MDLVGDYCSPADPFSPAVFGGVCLAVGWDYFELGVGAAATAMARLRFLKLPLSRLEWVDVVTV